MKISMENQIRSRLYKLPHNLDQDIDITHPLVREENTGYTFAYLLSTT